MKIAIITDTHYGCRRSSKVFHDYFQKFYDDIFFPELEKRGIKECIHMGDAFDNRKSIDFWVLRYGNLPAIMIPILRIPMRSIQLILS